MYDWLTPDRIVMLGWIYNAAVQALPDPLKGGSRFYLWLYRFAHIIAGNIHLVRRGPQLPHSSNGSLWRNMPPDKDWAGKTK